MISLRPMPRIEALRKTLDLETAAHAAFRDRATRVLGDQGTIRILDREVFEMTSLSRGIDAAGDKITTGDDGDVVVGGRAADRNLWPDVIGGEKTRGHVLVNVMHGVDRSHIE